MLEDGAVAQFRLAQGAFRQALGGDVAQGHQSGRAVVPGHRGGAHLHQAGVAAAAAQVQFVVTHRHGRRLAQHVGQVGQIGRIGPVAPQHGQRRRVGEAHQGFRVHHQHAVGVGADDGLQPLAVLAQRGLRAFAVDGVADGAADEPLGHLALAQVVLGAARHGLFGEGRAGKPGQHDDRQFRGVGDQAAQGVPALAVGQAEVQQGHVEFPAIQQGQAVGQRFRPLDGMGQARPGQQQAEQPGVAGVVLEQQNAHQPLVHECSGVVPDFMRRAAGAPRPVPSCRAPAGVAADPHQSPLNLPYGAGSRCPSRSARSAPPPPGTVPSPRAW